MKIGGLFLTNEKITQTALTASLAIVLGYVETLIPINIPIPGIKFGLSNFAVLFAVYRFGKKSAFSVICIKVFVTALLFSGMQSMIYSFAGGMLSFAAMVILKKFVSVKYVSIAGGIFHNVGQLTAAALVLKSIAVFWYLPYLLIGGIITGLLIGIGSEALLKFV